MPASRPLSHPPPPTPAPSPSPTPSLPPWPAALLARHRCRLRARISRHDYARHNLLIAQATTPLAAATAAGTTLTLDDSRWTISVNVNPLTARDTPLG
ncbi:MAG: hypothetical protein LBK99_02070, partial [Opitutaceae bacterium]|nr:hypothetical protein [Opitutaceae bacterium]